MGKTLGRREKLTGIPIGQTPLGAHPTRVGENSTRRNGRTKLGIRKFLRRGKSHRPDTVRCASD
jgi:hypothetical protein